MAPAALRAFDLLPSGAAPLHGESTRCKGAPLQRCLCCATDLRRLARDSGAVCAGATPIMRDATGWFREEVGKWHAATERERRAASERDGLEDAESACATTEEEDDEREAEGAVPGADEGEGAADVEELEEEEGEDGATRPLAGAEVSAGAQKPAAWTGVDVHGRYDAMLDTALVCRRGHVVLVYEIEPCDESDDDEGEEEDDDDWDEDDEWDDDDNDGDWDDDDDDEWPSDEDGSEDDDYDDDDVVYEDDVYEDDDDESEPSTGDSDGESAAGTNRQAPAGAAARDDGDDDDDGASGTNNDRGHGGVRSRNARRQASELPVVEAAFDY